MEASKKKYVYTYTKTCKGCGKEFTTNRYSTKTCSASCVRLVLAKQKAVYTVEQKLNSVKLREQGFTVSDISEQTGVKVSTLDKWFSDAGIVLTDEQYRNNVAGARWKNSETTPSGYKKCSGCNEIKPLDSFSVDKKRKHGRSLLCRQCSRDMYMQNADAVRERVSTYRRQNLSKIKELNARYYERNSDKYIQRAQEWARSNPEKRKIIERTYRSKHLAERRARLALYRAQKAKATPLWLTSEQKRAIEQIYKSCPKGYHVDHVVPLHGEFVCGLHVPWNLQCLPAACNMAKSNSFTPDVEEVGVCHQYKRRLDTLEEDIASGNPTGLEVRDFTLSHEYLSNEHRAFIERYEWLGTIGFGVRWVFTARHKGLLAGVVMLSEPNSYSSFGKKECLIQRGACAAWTPKCLGSSLVMYACKWMVQNTDKRLFVAYSDPEAGEIGTIYQACNFDYLGAFYGSKRLYQLPNGRWVNARYFTRTNAVKRWAKEIGIEWQPHWCKPNGFQDVKAIPRDILNLLRDYGRNQMLALPAKNIKPKGKYALLLGKDRREQKALEKQKTWQGLPYPKRRSK